MFLTSKIILKAEEVRYVKKEAWMLYSGVCEVFLHNHSMVIFWGPDKIQKAYFKKVYISSG